MKNQTFGVEIELTGITRESAASVIARHFGTSFSHLGGGYDTYIAKDAEGRTWKAVSDSSIRTTTKYGAIADNRYACEIVTPILLYKDIDTLQDIIRKLRKAGAIANSSCGIHIHIGAEKHTPATLRNLFNIINSKQDILYKALAINPVRTSYCKKLEPDLCKVLNAKKPRTTEAFKDIWYKDSIGNREYHYNETRYHGLNLHSVFTKGTVEFRLFNSTTHAGKIKAYIQLCLAINNQALTQKYASSTPTESTNEKYTFRTWLLRLGMIGDEFKTARTHLLSNLEGDIAWRNAA